MKIRLITFHTPKNYGAVLQAYSLMSILKSKCDDVEIIDYNTHHLRSLYPIVPKISGLKSLAFALLSIPNYPLKYKKYKKFEEFVNDNLILTKRYESVQKLYNEKWDKDIIFVCGSDQVFNPNRIEDEQKAFYMDFVPDVNYKFSYAASFGIKKIPEAKTEIIKKYLNKFNAISVREKSGVDLIKNISDKHVIDVIDPTLLNDIDFWEKIEKIYKKSFAKYLLYYRLIGSKESDQIAMRKAKENNLQLVVITESLLRGLRCDVALRDVGPKELLSLYHNASFVVSDSFHGIAFAVIYKKPFVFSDLNPALNERGLNLIQQLAINKVEVYGNKATGNIDYNIVNKRIEKMRKIANDFIEASLKEATEKEKSHEN